jgi:hypothetical protein
MGVIRIKLLNSKISTHSFSFVISLQILSISFPDRPRIAISDGPQPKESAYIFIFIFFNFIL